MAKERNYCRWYDETSAIKVACDQGKIDKKVGGGILLEWRQELRAKGPL